MAAQHLDRFAEAGDCSMTRLRRESIAPISVEAKPLGARNRKFESSSLQRGVCELSPRSPRRGCDAARPRSRGWREPSEALPPVGTQERGLSPNAPATARA